MLPDVLNPVRTLLCTATNSSPHERLFSFQRRSGTGTSLPSWLLEPGKVLLCRFVRRCKQEPLVDEVELLDANPHCACIRFPNGRETTVSVKDLAPKGQVREVPAPESDPAHVEVAVSGEIQDTQDQVGIPDPLSVVHSVYLITVTYCAIYYYHSM